jgi:glycosidase
LRLVFERRKQFEAGLLSSHGEAGRYFVSFLDNHDQHQRFAHPDTPQKQVLIALACLFTLQGIPAVYYGTEQGLRGTVHADGSPDLTSNESSREALWGKPDAFSRNSEFFAAIRRLAQLRTAEPALNAGRLYFREVSGNGRDFGHSRGTGGIIAYSRILSDTEITVVANTSALDRFRGLVLQDLDLNRPPRRLTVVYSNVGTTATSTVALIADARFFADDGTPAGAATAAAAAIDLGPMEVQILAMR